MFPAGNHEAIELEQRLRCAQAITRDLLSDVILHACTRLPALHPAVKAKIDRLVDSGAWNDAALALLEFELPQWVVRRLIRDDGEWLCSLSNQPGAPLELDDMAEASHASLPVAILLALLRARTAASGTQSVAVPSIRPVAGHVLCCDNFA
jgi:hypothetical protein